MDIAKQRYNRHAQQKHRGSRRCYRTEAEDALILLAWEAGELSEGQAAKALDVDRVTARDRRLAGISHGHDIGHALWTAVRDKQNAEISGGTPSTESDCCANKEDRHEL